MAMNFKESSHTFQFPFIELFQNWVRMFQSFKIGISKIISFITWHSLFMMSQNIGMVYELYLKTLHIFCILNINHLNTSSLISINRIFCSKFVPISFGFLIKKKNTIMIYNNTTCN